MRETGTTMTWTLDASGNLSGGYPAVTNKDFLDHLVSICKFAVNWYY